MKCVCNACCCRFTYCCYIVWTEFIKHKELQRKKIESCITFSFVEFIDISRIIWIGIFLFIYMRERGKELSEWMCAEVIVVTGWGKMQKRQFLLINLSKECICGFFFFFLFLPVFSFYSFNLFLFSFDKFYSNGMQRILFQERHSNRFEIT